MDICPQAEVTAFAQRYLACIIYISADDRSGYATQFYISLESYVLEPEPDFAPTIWRKIDL